MARVARSAVPVASSACSVASGAAPCSGVAPARIPAQRQSRRALRVRAQAAAADAKVYDAVIVGGGLSGLVTAQALAAKHGISNFLVTEARERVGGNITSMEGDGYVWEEGPNSFQPNDAMLQIAVRERGALRGGGRQFRGVWGPLRSLSLRCALFQHLAGQQLL